MEFDQADAIACRLIVQAGFNPERAVAVERIARNTPGILDVVRVKHGQLGRGASGALMSRPEGHTIYVGSSVPRKDLGFVIGHELGHFELARIGYRGEDVERLADRIAAALVAPRPAFLRMARALGLDHQRLAEAFLLTETCAILRIAEITDRPTLVVTPDTLYARGDQEFAWGPDPRGLARVRPLPEGLFRVVLGDARNRVALLAA